MSIDIDTIQPKGSNILIKRTNVGAISSDIIFIPGTAIKFNSVYAEVLKIGPGELMNNGEREPMIVSPGDKIISWGGYGHQIYEDKESIISLIDVSEIEGVLVEDALTLPPNSRRLTK